MKPLFLLLLAATLLCSCSVSKGLTTDTRTAPAHKNDPAMAYKKKVAATAQTAGTLTARLSVNIAAGGKDISCNGTLRMKKNDVLQISLTLPLLGTEVGRLECTPADVLVIDRFNKQYVRARYADVDFLAQAGLDFYALQALFWNELFVPGEKDDVAAHLSRFSVTESGTHTLLQLGDAPKLEYDFLTVTANAKIDRVSVRAKQAAEKGELVCSYGGFSTLNGKLFPTSMKLSVTDLGKDVTLTLGLSRLTNGSDWETRTTPGSKYRQRSVSDILGQIMKLAY